MKLGNNFSFQMPNTPMIDSSAVTVYVDGTGITSPIQYQDSSRGRIDLIDSSSTFWSDSLLGRNPTPGDPVRFDYHYSADGTDTASVSVFGFGISSYQMPHIPLVKNDSSTVATASDIIVSVNGTTITSPIFDLNPVLGHVTLNPNASFWALSELGRLPKVDDTVSFQYYYGMGYEFGLIWDEDGYIFDNDCSWDGDEDEAMQREATEIGYRYRAYLLHHSSVWNSPSTLEWNTFQKPAKRASIVNQQHSWNHYNLFFSPEFLYDKNPIKTLNDQYLDNGLTPVLKLHEGTPPFQKTFSYHPGLVYDQNLLTIRKTRHPLMYSDLLLKEFREENDAVELSSICDKKAIGFKIRMTETVPDLQECPEYLIWDDYETMDINIDLFGEVIGIPNLRVVGKKLRNNFQLRGRSATGISEQTYTTSGVVGATTIQLPATLVKQAGVDFESPYVDDGDLVTISGLPIMKDESTVAGPNDILVMVGNNQYPVSSLNPVTGLITLGKPLDNILRSYDIVLTQDDVDFKAVVLQNTPLDVYEVALTIIKGTSQYYSLDFFVIEGSLRWGGKALEGLLAAGDRIRVQYVAPPSPIVVTYYIESQKTAEIIDALHSRIFDGQYQTNEGDDVFDGCPLIGDTGLTIDLVDRPNEYVNFVTDYAEGIKYTYLNKDTYQIEEHVFTGPLFEMYDAYLDEIGSPESFPNALVRIPLMKVPDNPLERMWSVEFLNSPMIRIRKKTFKELLPNRTFRTTELLEALPV
jgi:hypothetical protein